MKTIHKYPIDIVDSQMLNVPRGAIPLYVNLDPRGVPCLWCSIDSTQESKPIQLFVIGTGLKKPIEADKYIGTFVWHLNGTVWHVFTT